MCLIMSPTRSPSTYLFHFSSGGSFVSPPFLLSLAHAVLSQARLHRVATGSPPWSFGVQKILTLELEPSGTGCDQHRARCPPTQGTPAASSYQNPTIYSKYIPILELDDGVSTITNWTYAWHGVHPSSLLTRLQALTPSQTEQVSITSLISCPCKTQTQEYNG